MNRRYHYSLDKGSTKFICPECGKKTFVRYFDEDNKEFLPEEFGRCDREVQCSYHLNPYKTDYFKKNTNNIHSNKYLHKSNIIRVKNETTTLVNIPYEVLSTTLIHENYDLNSFIKYLNQNTQFPFEWHDLQRVINHYYLGTIEYGYRKGAITFPFIDKKGAVRAIQVKQFNKDNHTIATDYIHSILKKEYQKINSELPKWLIDYEKNESKISCLFGEHLLTKYPMNPIALVEAPKTAVYATLYFDLPSSTNDFIWLAVYNLSSLNLQKCKELKGRKIVLFPDLSENGRAFDLWSKKAVDLNKNIPNSNFKVSNFLEEFATNEDKKRGADLADFLIKNDWRQFRRPQIQPIIITVQNKIEPITSENDELNEFCEDKKTKDIFDFDNKEINIVPSNSNIVLELEAFFESVNYPNKIKLNQCTIICNVKKFIESHLLVSKKNLNNKTFEPFIERLIELKNLLTII